MKFTFYQKESHQNKENMIEKALRSIRYDHRRKLSDLRYLLLIKIKKEIASPHFFKTIRKILKEILLKKGKKTLMTKTKIYQQAFLFKKNFLKSPYSIISDYNVPYFKIEKLEAKKYSKLQKKRREALLPPRRKPWYRSWHYKFAYIQSEGKEAYYKEHPLLPHEIKPKKKPEFDQVSYNFYQDTSILNAYSMHLSQLMIEKIKVNALYEYLKSKQAFDHKFTKRFNKNSYLYEGPVTFQLSTTKLKFKNNFKLFLWKYHTVIKTPLINYLYISCRERLEEVYFDLNYFCLHEIFLVGVIKKVLVKKKQILSWKLKCRIIRHFLDYEVMHTCIKKPENVARLLLPKITSFWQLLHAIRFIFYTGLNVVLRSVDIALRICRAPFFYYLKKMVKHRRYKKIDLYFITFYREIDKMWWDSDKAHEVRWIEGLITVIKQFNFYEDPDPGTCQYIDRADFAPMWITILHLICLIGFVILLLITLVSVILYLYSYFYLIQTDYNFDHKISEINFNFNDSYNYNDF
jgi:hypothetical protein